MNRCLKADERRFILRGQSAPGLIDGFAFEAQQDLLDTKEVAATLAADSIAKDATILDLQETVANLIVSTGGAV